MRGSIEFPDLVQMARLDEGFLYTPKARSVPPNPDDRYDLLEGEERLKALEVALSSARSGWDDDPAGPCSGLDQATGKTRPDSC